MGLAGNEKFGIWPFLAFLESEHVNEELIRVLEDLDKVDDM